MTMLQSPKPYYYIEIKRKLKRLKETDYIIIVNPNYDIKSLRSLGFVVHKVKIDYPYDTRGYYKGENPTHYKIIRVRSIDELNYLRIIHPKAIIEVAQVKEIIEHIAYAP